MSKFLNYLDKLRNKTIGILGLGYIGGNLFRLLESIIKDYNFELLAYDENNFDLIKNTTFDYFFNCAGYSGDFRSHILETVESNVGLTSFLLKNLKVRENFVSLSSTRIYGFLNFEGFEFDENYNDLDEHLELDYIYNGSKKLAESMLINYKNPEIKYISIARLSNVYGKFDSLNDSTLIKKIIRYKIENEKLVVKQNKKSTKDFIYIDDAIEGILRVGLLGNLSNIYNIANGKSYSLEDIEQFLNIKIDDNEELQVHFSNIDTFKAKQQVDFKAKITFQDGLVNTLEEYNINLYSTKIG